MPRLNGSPAKLDTDDHAMELVVLASGSSGNACLLRAGGTGVLIDAGLGPRKLVSQLKLMGLGWPEIDAMILTHTHGDHWNDRMLSRLSKMDIPFYCHRDHQAVLSRHGSGLAQLKSAKLARFYSEDGPLMFASGLLCQPIPVKHDSGPSFGFRFEVPRTLFQPEWTVGFSADLGTWDQRTAEAFANVNLLALEFNHDEVLQRQSRRPAYLIERVLGDEGHLSNRQAASLMREILELSKPHALETLVQIHLSRDCNRPDLALAAAQNVFDELQHQGQIWTADQFTPVRIPGPNHEPKRASLPTRN